MVYNFICENFALDDCLKLDIDLFVLPRDVKFPPCRRNTSMSVKVNLVKTPLTTNITF